MWSVINGTWTTTLDLDKLIVKSKVSWLHCICVLLHWYQLIQLCNVTQRYFICVLIKYCLYTTIHAEEIVISSAKIPQLILWLIWWDLIMLQSVLLNNFYAFYEQLIERVCKVSLVSITHLPMIFFFLLFQIILWTASRTCWHSTDVLFLIWP